MSSSSATGSPRSQSPSLFAQQEFQTRDVTCRLMKPSNDQVSSKTQFNLRIIGGDIHFGNTTSKVRVYTRNFSFPEGSNTIDFPMSMNFNPNINEADNTYKFEVTIIHPDKTQNTTKPVSFFYRDTACSAFTFQLTQDDSTNQVTIEEVRPIAQPEFAGAATVRETSPSHDTSEQEDPQGTVGSPNLSDLPPPPSPSTLKALGTFSEGSPEADEAFELPPPPSSLPVLENDRSLVKKGSEVKPPDREKAKLTLGSRTRRHRATKRSPIISTGWSGDDESESSNESNAE